MNSANNIRLANKAYSTIAIMELYADVDEIGRLVKDITQDNHYAGYHATTVYNYDLKTMWLSKRIKTSLCLPMML